MEISENEENKKANPVCKQPPTPLPTTEEYIVYTICICVHISAGTGFKKRGLYTLLKTYLSNQKVKTPLFCLIF